MLRLLMSMHEAARDQHKKKPSPSGLYPVAVLIDAEGNLAGDHDGILVTQVPLAVVEVDGGEVRFQHPDQHVTRASAAAIADVSVRTLQRYEGRDGPLVPVVIGEHGVRYKLTDLQEWLKGRSR